MVVDFDDYVSPGSKKCTYFLELWRSVVEGFRSLQGPLGRHLCGESLCCSAWPRQTRFAKVRALDEETWVRLLYGVILESAALSPFCQQSNAVHSWSGCSAGWCGDTCRRCRGGLGENPARRAWPIIGNSRKVDFSSLRFQVSCGCPLFQQRTRDSAECGGRIGPPTVHGTTGGRGR